MKITLERHAYAPELNCAYIGKSKIKIAAAGCASIKAVRTRLFAPCLPGLAAIITAKRMALAPGADKTLAGRVKSLADVRKGIDYLRAYSKGGVLLDGSILAPAVVTARIKLIG